MPLRVRFATAIALCALAFAAPGSAQDKKDAKDPKAREAALENLKKCKIAKPTIVETDNFLVAGSLSEDKAKALANTLEKTNALARKTLKYEDKESPWKGKLTVYFLPDSDEFKTFMRRVLQTAPEGAYIDIRAEPAHIVDPAELPGKPTDVDLYAATAARVAGEVLKGKGTATQVIPTWLRDGFGRVTVARAEGTTSKRYTAMKSAARLAVLGPKGGKPPALADVWADSKAPTTEALANSFSEFLAYGPKAADFIKFVEALRPSENVAAPTVQAQGFEALGWKDAMAPDAAWKRWVQTGK